MYFQQFYLSCLAHASYMIGSEGVAAVVDPQRDVEIYLEEAKAQNFRIVYIIETHLHADFVSGHHELAQRTGAEIVLGAKAGAKFPHRPAKDGDELQLGALTLSILETPGHTDESICILIHDPARGPDPCAVLTGDTLFIGEVGRPDLSPLHTPQELAALLYDSLHLKLMKLPDSVEVYPAHGAGSLCGRNISPERQSTIGKERRLNYALRPMSKETFVSLITAELPERPEYFGKDVELNRAGAPALAGYPRPAPLSPSEVLASQSDGALVLDTRGAVQFGAGNVPGSLHVALIGQFATWAGTLIGLERPVLLVVEEDGQVEEAVMRLARVGIEKVAGYLEGGILAWQKAGLPLNEVPQISVHQLHEQLRDDPGTLQVIDVRRQPEWDAGHIAQATLRPLHKLRQELEGLDRKRPVAVHCKSGYRSSIGTSILKASGFEQVMNVVGGFDAWVAQGLPVASGSGKPCPKS
jgi:glyoxylase-like metal-dependent hydrolase (beta-lactamase superfamily II)/3-mercaptopyruvate sulfurtransferase SseA